MGVGHTDNESAQHFDSEKLSQMFLVLWTGFEPLVFGSRVDALPTEPPQQNTDRRILIAASIRNEDL